MLKIVVTDDGSHTLYNSILDEHYHSVHGALTESLIVFIKNGYCSCSSNPVNIFEVGFGTGLNVFLTLIENIKDKRTVYYEAIDLFPLQNEIISKLNYPDFYDAQAKSLFLKIHSAPWGKETIIAENFRLKKIHANLLTYNPKTKFNLIYFDAFGPDKQKEMWSEEVIVKIADVIDPGGIFVTYSVKGNVKRLLIKHGFRIELMPGPPHKRHVLRAIKY